MNYKHLFTFGFSLLVFHSAFAQTNMTLDRDFLLPYEAGLNSVKSTAFTSIMPYDKEKTDKILQGDSLPEFRDMIIKGKPGLPAKGKFSNNISVLGDGNAGFDALGKKPFFDYYGGVHLDGTIGNKFSYSGNYLGGDIYGPSFMDSFIKQSKVVPGMGFAYGSASKGYSYQYWDFCLSYMLNNIFNFQLGKGKTFWGDGYRSLFLSDVSTSYPYFKITATVWHIQFVSMITAMEDAENPSGLTRDFHTKYSSFHYISWNVSKRINVSLFEAITYDGDSGNYVRGFDPEYLNPILFYQPVNYNIGDPDKSNLGIGYKIKVAQKEQFYGQIIIDEFKLHNVIHHTGWWGNKQGVQLGFKAFDLFKVKNLSLQTEVNYIRPYTYTARDPLQNYSNFNQPLADPEGANFIESCSFLTYFHKNLIVQGSAIVYHYGADKGSLDYGQDIFINYNEHVTEYGNYVGQGVSTYLGIAGIKADYIISPKMNLKAEVGMYERFEKATGSESISEPYISVGVKTSLGNLYNDF